MKNSFGDALYLQGRVHVFHEETTPLNDNRFMNLINAGLIAITVADISSTRTPGLHIKVNLVLKGHFTRSLR
jgi:hypothetical protein